MKIIQITLTTAPSVPTKYNYKVEIQSPTNSSTWNLVHTGKFYAFAGQTTVTLDLDDVLYNHRFQMLQILQPTLNITANEWNMPALGSNMVNCSEYWYSNVKVTSLDDTPAFTAVTKKFDFMPAYDLCGNARTSLAVVTNGGYVPIARTDQPTPHIPNNPPSGFQWGQPVYIYTSNNTNITVVSKRDDTQITNQGKKVSQMVKLYGTGTNASSTYTIGVGINPNIRYYTVTKVDSCNKPYYLIWMTNEGGLQCQGFLKSSEFSIEYKNTDRVDMHNSEWKVNSTTTGNWKLKTQNLNDSEYKAYGDMFNSPYVILLDMENSRLHYVNIKTSTYNEKKRTRNDKKPFYYEVEVQTADHLNV